MTSTEGMVFDLLWKYGNCKNLFETLGYWLLASS